MEFVTEWRDSLFTQQTEVTMYEVPGTQMSVEENEEIWLIRVDPLYPVHCKMFVIISILFCVSMTKEVVVITQNYKLTMSQLQNKCQLENPHPPESVMYLNLTMEAVR